MANIFDCENQEIKIGKTSITIKNRDTGKTKGIVKGITKFKDMQPNKQMQYFKKLKSLNIWGIKWLIWTMLLFRMEVSFCLET